MSAHLRLCRTWRIVGRCAFVVAVACAAANAATHARANVAYVGSQAPADFKLIKFDAAMEGQLGLSLPLNVAFPRAYERHVLDPAINGVIWAAPGDLERMRETGEIPEGAGYFHGRLTINVGYDARKDSFICGKDCDEGRIVEKIAAMGAKDIKTQRAVANGIPILLIEADATTLQGSVRNRLYMAYIALRLDTDVFLITYRAPAASEDNGAAAWNAFTTTLIESSGAVAAGPPPAPPEARLSFEGYIDMANRSGEFRRVADGFMSAAVAGDASKSMGLIGRHSLERVGRDAAQTYMTETVLPFFAQFRELERSVTVAPTRDERGSQGFVFHLSMRAKDGAARPFSIYVIDEDGAKVIANVVVDQDLAKAR